MKEGLREDVGYRGATASIDNVITSLMANATGLIGWMLDCSSKIFLLSFLYNFFIAVMAKLCMEYVYYIYTYIL